MAKVYVVTSGSYSDYGIDRIFLNKEKAETYHELIKRTHYDVNDIEEYDLSDDEVFTPYYYIEFVYYIPGMEDKYGRTRIKGRPSLFGGEYYIDIYKCKDGDIYTPKRSTDYTNGTITLIRPIGYNKDKVNLDFLKEKYLKVCQDLSAQIRYHFYMGGNEWGLYRTGWFNEVDNMYFESEEEIQD